MNALYFYPRHFILHTFPVAPPPGLNIDQTDNKLLIVAA